MPLSWRSAAAIAVLAALVLASMQPSAAAPPATRRPNPLERFRSWDEAWAALSPYARSSPKNAFCGSGPTVAAACGESSILSLWKAWKLAYRKKDDKRYGYFRTNVVKIARALQTCPKALWPKLTNNYMDWSAAELARHNIKMWVPPTKPDELIGPKSGPPQSSWDWRKLGKVTPAKDQGRCGSCYAFAAAGAIESKLLIQFNKTTKDYLVDLSEQQLVDCANAKAGRSLTGGCDGGNFNDVLWYSARSPVLKEDQYPYTSGGTGAAGSCKATPTARSPVGDKVQLTGGGFKQLRPWSAAALRQAVQIAPVMVGMYLPEGSMYEFFSDGLWGAANCKLPPGPPNATDAALKINHAVLVVGYQMTTKPYHWIINKG